MEETIVRTQRKRASIDWKQSFRILSLSSQSIAYNAHSSLDIWNTEVGSYNKSGTCESTGNGHDDDDDDYYDVKDNDHDDGDDYMTMMVMMATTLTIKMIMIIMVTAMTMMMTMIRATTMVKTHKDDDIMITTTPMTTIAMTGMLMVNLVSRNQQFLLQLRLLHVCLSVSAWMGMVMMMMTMMSMALG